MDGSTSQSTSGRGRRPPARSRGRGGRTRPDPVFRRRLQQGADRLATRLARWGVSRGDRVGLWLPKSLEAVTAIHGILRSGAAYVPVDPTGPAVRAAAIFAASGVKAVVVACALAIALREAWAGPGPSPRLIVVEGTEQPASRRGRIRAFSAGEVDRRRATPAGRRSWPTTRLAPAPCARRGRSGLHPLHLGLDRAAQGVMLSHRTPSPSWIGASGRLAPGTTTIASPPMLRSISTSRSSTSSSPAGTRRPWS